MPLLLFEDQADYGPKSYKFYDSWLKKEGMEDLVRSMWNEEIQSPYPDGVFRDKLKRVKATLKEWKKEGSGFWSKTS